MKHMEFSELYNFLHSQLIEEIMPFWLEHAVDWGKGGILTGINDDGSVNTTNKYIWSNTRAIYTFSALYNYVGRDDRWLKAATNVCEFCLKYGCVDKGEWAYLVDREGRLLERSNSIQIEAFAIAGLVEYARATGDQWAVEAAMETYESAKDRLSRPGSYSTFPYEIPKGSKAHKVRMQFALSFFELGSFLERDDILESALALADEIMDHFRRPEHQVLHEYIGTDNRLLDSAAGREMCPGHTVESMWFLIHVYRHFGMKERIAQAVETMRWAMEKGWDPEYGGLFLSTDVEGKEPYHKNWEKKIWWVFTEALYGMLLAYEYTGQSWCMDWYWKVHDWSFSHFPDREHGEWTQRLNRQGEKVDTLIALPVKDPFHLPRNLILCLDVLGRLK